MNRKKSTWCIGTLIEHAFFCLRHGLLGLLALCIIVPAHAESGLKSYAYVNRNYIITAEVAGEHAFVVNFINLSDFVLVIQPSEFIYRGSSGRYYIGQVFEIEHKGLRGESQPYSASFLLKEHRFVGLKIVGVFHEKEQIEEISVRIGAKRFFMQPLEKAGFEQLAKKIGDLDLETEDSGAMLESANIAAMGNIKSADGSSEWDRDWQGLLSEEGVNPPKFLERPEISATPEARKSHTYGKVKLSGIINKNGGIQDLKVTKGLGKGLDERAIEGIKNSWLFLPATKNGEVVDTQIFIEVEFPEPGKK